METTTTPTRHAPPGRLRRLESEFLRPHRRAIFLALAAMLLQSVLLLPVPVLQGRVLDRLIGPRPGDDAAALTWLVLGVFAASAGCHFGRAALSWRASAA